MGLLESISRWRPWKARAKVDGIPFEELQNRYSEDANATYKEFIRRLHQLIFYAASEYLERTKGRRRQEEIENIVIGIFEEFSPQFAIGSPDKILVRFAQVIRNQLDDKAFRVIAALFYKQIPIYHLSDEGERRLLAAVYEEGLSTPMKVLADRFKMTVKDVENGLTKANSNLCSVMQRDFESGELKEMTEGYLS